MDKITQKFLDARLERINRAMGRPIAPYTKTADGKFVPNIGNWNFDHAYGGIALHEIGNEDGGIRTIKHGYGTKREMDIFLDGVMKTIEAAESAYMVSFDFGATFEVRAMNAAAARGYARECYSESHGEVVSVSRSEDK